MHELYQDFLGLQNHTQTDKFLRQRYGYSLTYRWLTYVKPCSNSFWGSQDMLPVCIPHVTLCFFPSLLNMAALLT